MSLGSFRDSYFLDASGFAAGPAAMVKLAMAIDKRQERLKVGDVVHVPCRIVNVHGSDKHHNLLVETLDPVYPTDRTVQVALNGRQCLKQSRKTQVQPAPQAAAPESPTPAPQQLPPEESHGSDQANADKPAA